MPETKRKAMTTRYGCQRRRESIARGREQSEQDPELGHVGRKGERRALPIKRGGLGQETGREARRVKGRQKRAW